jgi:hypothetical protein
MAAVERGRAGGPDARLVAHADEGCGHPCDASQHGPRHGQGVVHVEDQLAELEVMLVLGLEHS